MSINQTIFATSTERLENPPHPSTNPRYKAIFQRHYNDPTSRLVKGLFALGPDVVHLLVALQKDGVDEDGAPQYVVLNSCAQYVRGPSSTA